MSCCRSAFVLTVALGCAGTVEPRVGQERKLTRGDLGLLFATLDEAAKAGCAYIWKNEWRAPRIEYCGVIYRDAEGIKAGLPETVGNAGNCILPLEPPGTEAEASYHNHKQSEEFSEPDRQNPTILSVYLCTPSGLVKRRTREGLVIVK
jgi:hypothetical protein